MVYVIIKRKSIALAFVFLIGLACVLASLHWTQGSAMMLGKPIRRPSPINSVNVPSKLVALSFDTSTDSQYTDQILDILRANSIPSTYFVLGEWTSSKPELVQKLGSDDNIEIGSQSNKRTDLTKLKANQVQAEIASSVDILSKSIDKPIKLFRSPFESYNNTVLNAVATAGLHAIGSSINVFLTDDIQSVATRVLQNIDNGGIVLLNDFEKHTVDILPLLISGLQNKGFEFVKIGDMVYEDNYLIDTNGRQQKK